MTNSHPRQSFAAALSANDQFKLGYPKYLRRAVLAALVLTALLVWLFPRYEPAAYTLRQTEIVIIDVMEPVDPIEQPKPLEVPRIPPVVAVVEDPGDADPILEPWLIDPMPVPVQPVYYQNATPFVASSAKPMLTFQMKADYPEIARRAELQGTVVVNVLVGVDGYVKKTVVVRGVHPLLDRAATRAAARCRFEPATQRKMPVKAWVAIPYRFRLR